ncbi:uncharacterized protein LOC130121231 [Lampris incognitus]|uniref:uncharacterized protein LOC130121231 n=1 Tax=Lampris incognitus TaxID=2546036 RepID=UPI0024B4D9CF|nr:uncharacterized protein LOC130121231 [Lampris incognitus]
MASLPLTYREWWNEMDQKLIDFWKQHECLFNSRNPSYYNKKLKTKLWLDFASSVGLHVSDVERRSRSLRTQYGRLIGHPDKVTTSKKRMLKEQLSFLRPYIFPRLKVTDCQGERDGYDDEEEQDGDEDEEEEETEDSMETESLVDVNVSGVYIREHQSVALTAHTATRYCPPTQLKVREMADLACNHENNESQQHRTHQTAGVTKCDVLNQFVKVMLADMHQIKDPLLLMQLRRDITNLVFKTLEEDLKRRCV